jgi:thymidylate synthase ThyX
MSLTEIEATQISAYFTNTDRPVFALTNLPETVKGALFARYSRSPKSLRRLFLDEFYDAVGAADGTEAGRRHRRRESPSVPTSCISGCSTTTATIQWPSSAACTWPWRMRRTSSPRFSSAAGSWPTSNSPHATSLTPSAAATDGGTSVPAELEGHPLQTQYVHTLNAAFEIYAKWIPVMQEWFASRHPKAASDSDAVYRAAIRAKALDTLRGMLPAATQSNVGIFGTGQAYETLLLRMRAHPLAEVRATADSMLEELRKVIPAFLTRVDQPDRGGRWSAYLEDSRKRTIELAARLTADAAAAPADEVTLTDFDPEGEVKVVAAALYAASTVSDHDAIATARRLTAADRESVLRAYVGDRTNRRHKPGRAFERTGYRFDILTDYGAFRDLQRHRLMTIDWQALSPRHGYVQPEAFVDAGGDRDWREVMDRSADLYDALCNAGFTDAAQYAVAMAYRVRFVMDMNAREAMHVIELRTAPQGHPAYRRVCQRMHTLISEVAGHHAIAGAMQFADHSQVELERLQEERRIEQKRERSRAGQ